MLRARGQLLCTLRNRSAVSSQRITSQNVRQPRRPMAERVKEAALKYKRQRRQTVQRKVEMMLQEWEHADERDLRLADLADKVFSRGTNVVGHAANIHYLPLGNPAVPEVMVCGAAGAGKTKLIQALAKSRIGGLNNQSGTTYFHVGRCFFIADTPGYGERVTYWTTVLRHAALIRNYISTRPNLKMTYVVCEVERNRGFTHRDLDLIQFMAAECPNFTVVLTKTDMYSSNKIQHTIDELRRRGIEQPVVATSTVTMQGIDTLRYDMVANISHSLPFERLTLRQVHKLSLPVMTADQLRQVEGGHRVAALPPSEVDIELADWQADRRQEEAAKKGEQANRGELVACKAGDAVVVTDKERKRQEDQLALAQSTAPLRNPTLWSKNITLSEGAGRLAHHVSHPQDPTNPYLSPPKFVARRADHVFRKPPGRRKRRKGKIGEGTYLVQDGTFFERLQKRYSIPFFPEIVDVSMNPRPHTFLPGSVDEYYTRPNARLFGLAMWHRAVGGVVRALEDKPFPTASQLRIAGGTMKDAKAVVQLHSQLQLEENQRTEKPAQLPSAEPKVIEGAADDSETKAEGRVSSDYLPSSTLNF